MVLRVGYDARAAVLDRYRGLGRVAREHLVHLAALEELELVAFLPRGVPVPEALAGRRIEVVELPHPRRGAFLFDGPAWRWVLRRHPVDVLHLPAWGVPPGVPVPVVATLHDVTPIRYPGAIPRARTQRRAVGRLETYRRASLVHAVSRATARDAVHCLGIRPDRVRTVPNGVAAPPPDRDTPRSHALWVGGADPHKRIGLLIEAWTAHGVDDLPPLVVAGGASEDPAVRAASRRVPGRIRLVGTLDDAALGALYSGAIAVLVPSLWEGFGLPALEGMRYGAVPILTARSALPEAGGDAALYVPPDAPPEEWAEAVRRLTRDVELLERLRKAGRKRVGKLSWERVARELVPLYREVRILASS